MGPRSDERGNPATATSERMEAPMLQWGRAPMSAEIYYMVVTQLDFLIWLQWGRAPMSAEIRAAGDRKSVV